MVSAVLDSFSQPGSADKYRHQKEPSFAPSTTLVSASPTSARWGRGKFMNKKTIRGGLGCWMFKTYTSSSPHITGRSKRRSHMVKRKRSSGARQMQQESYDLLYQDIFTGLPDIHKYSNLDNEETDDVAAEELDQNTKETHDLIAASTTTKSISKRSPTKSSSFSDLSDFNPNSDNMSAKIDKMSPYAQYLDISGLGDLGKLHSQDKHQRTMIAAKHSKLNLKTWYALPKYRYIQSSPPHYSKSRDTSPASTNESPRSSNKKISRTELFFKDHHKRRAKVREDSGKIHRGNKDGGGESPNGTNTNNSPINTINGATISNNLSELEWETESLTLLQ